MLLTFFDKFPWLRANEFVLTGESYAGVYVPMTAKRIVEGNERGDGPRINLKSFAVGNGVNEFLPASRVALAYYHGIISTDEFERVDTACPGLLKPGAKPPRDVSTECTEALNVPAIAMDAANISYYNVYSTCSGGSDEEMDRLLDELRSPLEPEKSDQNAGFVEDFGPLKFKGSGHRVPTDKSAEAKAMLDQFVLGIIE